MSENATMSAGVCGACEGISNSPGIPGFALDEPLVEPHERHVKLCMDASSNVCYAWGSP
jgi:hypothetical protein